MTYLYSSPLGHIRYDWDGEVCHRIFLQQEQGKKHNHSLLSHTDPVSLWFECYFNGEMQAQTMPPLAPAATLFQQRMREELVKISAAEVRTYGEMAKVLHTSPRALGQALGANPLPIIIPCHRIVAAGGLGGFAAGSRWKQQLLNFEAALWI